MGAAAAAEVDWAKTPSAVRHEIEAGQKIQVGHDVADLTEFLLASIFVLLDFQAIRFGEAAHFCYLQTL